MTKRLLLAFVLFSLCFCGTLQTVYAYDPFSTVCGQSGAGSSAVCSSKTTTNPFIGPSGIIIKATDIIAFLGGVAAVVLLMIGGFRYITSGGDAGNVASAKNTIVNALIGIAVIALARTIIGFVISKI